MKKHKRLIWLVLLMLLPALAGCVAEVEAIPDARETFVIDWESPVFAPKAEKAEYVQTVLLPALQKTEAMYNVSAEERAALRQETCSHRTTRYFYDNDTHTQFCTLCRKNLETAPHEGDTYTYAGSLYLDDSVTLHLYVSKCACGGVAKCLYSTKLYIEYYQQYGG